MVNQTIAEKVIPENCKRCVSGSEYIFEGVKTYQCVKQLPMKDPCLWFSARPYYERQRT